MVKPIIFIGVTNMRYTVEYNVFIDRYVVIMDKGYPSESIYDEYNDYKEAKLVCDKLNEEENNG